MVRLGQESSGGSLPAATRAALEASAGVTHLASTNFAFVARTEEGGWYAWGHSMFGGSLPAATQAALE
eukprot:COSAG02_NODE_44006_length_368_cov_7.355556_1_plen_67_part_01